MHLPSEHESISNEGVAILRLKLKLKLKLLKAALLFGRSAPFRRFERDALACSRVVVGCVTFSPEQQRPLRHYRGVEDRGTHSHCGAHSDGHSFVHVCHTSTVRLFTKGVLQDD